jgi:folate-binding protein YgfZ
MRTGNQPGSVCVLDDLGTLRFSGADAGKFLQGQLSNDVSALSASALLRAGLHNPQGRTLALLWLIAIDNGDVLALLPRELLDVIASQLRRYILRAKLTISDESAQHRIYGLAAPDACPQGAGRRIAYGAREQQRVLLLQSAAEPAPQDATMSRDHWRGLDIAAGLPQVYGATSGQFVAQMLNLDCIDAISFTKGCYTGQEVIARAHYRGRIKRRLQRFASRAAPHLAAGDSGRLDDGRGFRVVEAVAQADGGCEFLAVAALPGAAPEPDEGGLAPVQGLAYSTLPLPYALPE